MRDALSKEEAGGGRRVVRDAVTVGEDDQRGIGDERCTCTIFTLLLPVKSICKKVVRDALSKEEAGGEGRGNHRR